MVKKIGPEIASNSFDRIRIVRKPIRMPQPPRRRATCDFLKNISPYDENLFGLFENCFIFDLSKHRNMTNSKSTITAAERNKAVNQLNAPAKALYNKIIEFGSFPIPNGRGLLSAAQDLEYSGLVIFRWDLFRILLTPTK